MLGIPSIETLRANFGGFANRGAEPSFNFAQRFGGYQGTAAVAQSFKAEPSEAFKRTMKEDSKSINDAISSVIDEKIKEQAPQPSQTYTKSQIPPRAFKFSLPYEDISTEPSFYKDMAGRSEVDAGLTNAAAALKTTDQQMYGNIDTNAILNWAKNIPGSNTATNIPPVEPVVEPPPYNPPPVYVPPPPPPYKPVPYEPPVVTPAPTPTYSRADTTDDEEIDSIDVTGRTTGAISPDDEEIDSIDVTGAGRDYLREARAAEQEQAKQNVIDNPWERFKALYADFYTGGRGEELLKEYDAKNGPDESKSLGYDDLVSEYGSSNSLNKDTNDILNAKNEKDQLMQISNAMRDTSEARGSGTTIINNNQTIATSKTQDSSRTASVFSNESTFNRATSADLQHPRY